MKCFCGCSEFYAKQICYLDVVVDERGKFIRNLRDNDAAKSIYEAEVPYSPFQ